MIASENHGAPHARNIGLAAVRGEYVLFVDADDYLEGPVIPGLLEVAARTPTDLVIGRSVTESPDGKRSRPLEITDQLSNEQLVRHWLKGYCVQTGGMLWRKSFLERIGGWNDAAVPDEDIELVLRALLRGARVGISNRGWVIWCDHDEPQRLSRRNPRRGQEVRIAFNCALAAVAREKMPSVVPDFAENLYTIAYRCFGSGYDDLGKKSLAASRALGYRKNAGPPARRLLSSVLGLRLALRLEMLLHRLLKALPLFN